MISRGYAVKRLIGVGLLILSLLLAACGGAESEQADGGQKSYGQVVRFSGVTYRAISPDELAEMLQTHDLTVVNVHIPYEGELEPTDAFIPYSEIEKHLDQLPSDKSAPIVLYCRKGVMSRDAARVLAKLGYTGIYDLKGGLQAWKASGRPVLVKPD